MNLVKLAEQALADKASLPYYTCTALEILIHQIMALSDEIAVLDRQLMA